MVLLCLAFIACYAAWALAALAMPAHRKAIRWLAGRSHPSALTMRGLALVQGALSLGLCVVRDGWGMGVLLWVCTVCVTGLLVVLTLAWLNPADGFARRRP